MNSLSSLPHSLPSSPPVPPSVSVSDLPREGGGACGKRAGEGEVDGLGREDEERAEVMGSLIPERLNAEMRTQLFISENTHESA
eukprot:195688-Rhodomonas_salina.1